MLGLLGRRKAKDAQPNLDEILGSFELPSFPAVILAALEKIRDDDASIAEATDVIAADPGLTARLIDTVNSAAFGLRHTVRSVQHAASLLGRSQVESMLISLAVRDAVPNAAGPGFDAQRFWRTAARRAVTARAIADEIDPAARSESFTASLLQDMALPILTRARQQEYGGVLEQWHASTADLAQMEREEFGWTHAGVAGAMCERWSFPPAIGEAIRSHHDGIDGEDTPSDGLVSVRIVAPLREVNEAAGVEYLVESMHGALGLSKDRASALVERSFDEAETLSHLFTT